MKHRSLVFALALIAPALRTARAGDPPLAEPAPADEDPVKREARALLREGVRLLGTGDNAGALALFRSAYGKFPSAKILLNIGSTLKTMGRLAEAANTYQRYLDAADTDPAKRATVEAQLAELDRSLGTLTIAIDQPDAEIEIDGAWYPAASMKTVRVAAGAYTLRARKAGMPDATATGEVIGGASAVATLTLAPKAAPVETPVEPRPVVAPVVQPAGPSIAVAVAPRSPARVGAAVRAIVDGKGRGGAALVGALFDVAPRVELEAGVLIGPHVGAYAGAVGYATLGALRPRLAIGAPVFFSTGARVALRGAAGIEWRQSRHLAIVAEVGVERYLNAEGDIDKTGVAPVVGVNGRL